MELINIMNKYFFISIILIITESVFILLNLKYLGTIPVILSSALYQINKNSTNYKFLFDLTILLFALYLVGNISMFVLSSIEKNAYDKKLQVLL
jgi:hypothetical protein